MTIIFETPRLALRVWQDDDAEALFEICRHAEVMLHIGEREPYSKIDEARRFINRAQGYQKENGFSRWAVVEKSSGKVIGSCGFARLTVTGEIELGYLFARDVWGRGLATEAAGACLRYGFEKLNFTQVVALTDPCHTASQRVLEKIGFTCRGLELYDGDSNKVYVAVNPQHTCSR